MGDLEAALTWAVAAGAVLEHGPDGVGFGRIAVLADPFGHGFCLVQFTTEDYNALVDDAG